jgi:ribosome biogenesis GTPase
MTEDFKQERTMDLNKLGWNDFFNQHFEKYKKDGLIPARVARHHKNRYAVFGEAGEIPAEVTGKMLYAAQSESELPAIGDWVALKHLESENRGIVQAILPRKSQFTRKTAGKKTEAQVLAANIDIIFLVSGMDLEFNLRRIERYLTLAWESGAEPVIILNKTDLCQDIAGCVAEVESIAFGIPLLTMSAFNNEGIDELIRYLKNGKTAAFLGSSGVGKSSIINCLLGENRQAVKTVRQHDSRGRHTTTIREMIFLPAGGIVIDTPGLREIQLWTEADGLAKAFDDIEAFAALCRFNDCSHNNEPGCAVRQALEDGSLTEERLRSYFKLKKEQSHLSMKKKHYEYRKAQRRFDKKIKQILKERNELKDRGLI